VIGVHHAFGDYQRKGRRLFANLFRKRLSLLGVSDAVRDDMRRCLPQWPAERIQTLYNRIDVDALQASLVPRAEARQALGLDEQAWVVGNVGRLHPDKDQATLLRGFAEALPGLPAGAAWRSSARAAWRRTSRRWPPSWVLPRRWTSSARCRMRAVISRPSMCSP
jgi:glycosyltransferase involved in cell wall biosynthesis